MTFAPLKDEQRRRIACREAGVSVATVKLATRRGLVRVQIYPKCRVFGQTESRANPIQRLASKDDQLADLYIVLAGRAAEEVLFEDKSPLSETHLLQATRMAELLATRYGVKASPDEIIAQAYEFVKKFIEQHRASVTNVAEALLKQGELSAEQVEAIIDRTPSVLPPTT
jgi:ATP-dependent Zn protease